MPQHLECLCPNNITDCNDCAARARETWMAYRSQKPQATPGQIMEQAIQEGNAEAVLGILQNTDIPLNQPCDPQRYGSVSPMMAALRANNPLIVALIAGRSGFDLQESLAEYETWSWVHFASLEVLRQYLSIPGSDVNQPDGNGKTLLHEVVFDTHSDDKLRELLSRPSIIVDAKQNDGTTPLYRAGLAGNAGAFALVLDHGADVNNRNNDNRWTILICAASVNHDVIAEQALRRPETEVNAVDDIQNTALHIACERGHIRIVELLIQRPDIRINLKNHLGWTPLSKAAFSGHAEIVKLLLARPELEVNFVDQYRQTPLFHAASTGQLAVVHLLLADPRANVAIRNRPSHHTAFDMAEALGFTAIAQLISQRRDKVDELSPNDNYVERPI
jgi:ankyrin repeat protein